MANQPGSDESKSQDGHGKVDTTSVLYIAGGIPVIVGFVVILFLLTRACGLPA